MKFLWYTIFFLFCLFSGWTWTESEGGSISSRLTYADIIGLISIIVAVFYAASNKFKIYLPKEYLLYLPFLILTLFSCIFSFLYEKALFEYLIHIFIFLVSLSFLNIFLIKNNFDIHRIFQCCLYASFIISSIGLLHFFIFPGWFPGTEGGLSGTFRNTGQAGSYFGVFFAILFPAILSGILKRNMINILFLFTIFLALIFTFKRAAILGVFSGFIFLMIQSFISRKVEDKKIGLFILSTLFIFIFIFIFIYSWGVQNISGMEDRVQNKFNTNTVDDFKTGFFAENVEVTLKAFWDKPLFGVGLGNVIGVYSDEYEIHSSYMAIIASSGLIGFCGYLFYMAYFFYKIIKINLNSSSIYSIYLKYLFPFIVGLILSWGYTYHLRKREFWILFFVVSLIFYLERIKNRKKV